MCSSTDKAIIRSDLALQGAQTASFNTLTQDYATAFAESQATLGSVQAKLNYIASNPMGYTPAEIAGMKTNINETTANGAKQAIGAASAYAAAHGGADTGSGVVGELAGQIGSAAAQSKSQQLTQLSEQDAQLKQQNFWKAISGLGSTAGAYQDAANTSVSGASNMAKGAVDAGSGALAGENAEFDQVGGIISAVGGLASAGAGIAADFNQGGGAAQPNAAGGTDDIPEGDVVPDQQYA